MKLTLTDDDGVVIERWRIEDDFGDVSKPIPAVLLKEAVVDAVRKAKAEGAQ